MLGIEIQGPGLHLWEMRTSLAFRGLDVGGGAALLWRLPHLSVYYSLSDPLFFVIPFGSSPWTFTPFSFGKGSGMVLASQP